MSSYTNSRKYEHIDIILNDQKTDRNKAYFDAIQLTHRALPELDFDEIDTSTHFMGKKLSFPLLISSMTGGDHEMVKKINTNLAIAAEQTGIAMAVGSQRVLFSNPDSKPSFELRQYAPNALLFSNIGAVQLNYGFNEQQCQQAIDVLQADGLFFHLNPLQEIIQPEGDCNFKGLIKKIGDITKKIDKPVILKEVGCGMSPQDIQLGLANNIHYFDVAGSGGTSWSRIESKRQNNQEPNNTGIQFQDWGIPTPLALAQLKPFVDNNKIKLIASGGLKTGIDMVKSIILGASLCGMAKPFLEPATQSAEQVITIIQNLLKEFKTAMFLMGINNVNQLFNNSTLILNKQVIV